MASFYFLSLQGEKISSYWYDSRICRRVSVIREEYHYAWEIVRSANPSDYKSENFHSRSSNQ